MQVTVVLTSSEIELLKELLATDLDAAGFDEREVQILNNVYEKIK